MMALPFTVFCIIIITGRKELGWKGVAVFVGIWAALLSLWITLEINRYFFIAAQAILDVILISTIYFSFTRLR